MAIDKNSDIAIRVSNVSKSFKIYYDKGNSLKDKVLFHKRNRYERRKVLNDVSFEIKKGQAVGLIGHNGCGKSTLLKLITRILFPDTGSIELSGRVSSLLELGAGFHPDMSGRENIYTNASIFGLDKEEIDRRIEGIIEFSELGEFIDNPVRTYSSGMYMRLAFSVAINVNADILLIDEILAVGDTNFQTKCFKKLQEIKDEGTTIVIVSHSLDQVEQICDRSIWIHAGLIKEDGEPVSVHKDYLDYMMKSRKNNVTLAQMTEEVERAIAAKENTTNALRHGMEKEQLEAVADGDELRWGNKDAEITKVTVTNSAGKPCKFFAVGEQVHFKVDYKVNKPIDGAVFGIGIYRSWDGLNIYGTNTMLEKLDGFDLSEDGSFEIDLPSFELMPAKYVVGFSIEFEHGTPIDYWKTACEIETYNPDGDVGAIHIGHNWTFPDVPRSKIE